jgi:MFS family permease
VQPSLSAVARTLWASATFRHLLLCFAVFSFFNYGVLTWQPTFFLRSYGFSTGELGTWLAVIYGLGGIAGSYLGGEMASRYANHNESLQLKAMALAIVIAGVLSIFVYLSSTPYSAFALTGLFVLGLSTVNGPLFATIQTLVPERMRAVSFALVYLVANFIGMGLGPLAVGALSDALRGWAGDDSLRYALMSLAPGYLWCVWHAWRASRSVSRDLIIGGGCQ